MQSTQQRILIAQINPIVGAIEQNTNRIVDIVVNNQSTHDLIIFPELTITGYPPEDLLLRQECFNRVENALTTISQITTGCHVIVGHPRSIETSNTEHTRDYTHQRLPTCYNAASIIHQGQCVKRYYKQRLPNDGVFDEYRYFTPGPPQPCIFQVGNITYGLCICEDLWQLGPMQQLIDHNIHHVICINASPFTQTKPSRRMKLLRHYAQHDINIIYVNQIGGQDELVFDGQSLIIDNAGDIVIQAPAFEEALLSVNKYGDDTLGDVKFIQEKINIRLLSKPAAESEVRGDSARRTGVYRSVHEDSSTESTKQFASAVGFGMKSIDKASDPMTGPRPNRRQALCGDNPFTPQLLYQALCCGLHDHVIKNHFSGVILGLSGGIDSALTLTIAVDALGADNVYAVMLPSRFTHPMSEEDAQQQIDTLKVKSRTLSIEPLFKAGLETLCCTRSIALDPHRTKNNGVWQENLQARIRGMLLMALSNQYNYLLINTSNKSEIAVGYSTLYGDMNGGFSPLKDVLKTQVYALAYFRNSVSPVIPERVLQRPPTAELAPNQTDQNTLPEYALLDAILYLYMEQNLSAEQLIQRGFNSMVVTQILSLLKRNEFKRHQAPPGIKISDCAFGKDWRYPLTSGF